MADACSVAGCEGKGTLNKSSGNSYFTKGYCNSHYHVFRTRGDALLMSRPKDGRCKDSRWSVYRNMLSRCRNENVRSYDRYGGRGIGVCSRWLEPGGAGFVNFCEDMGPRPEGSSIDRVDNNSGYSPLNCRWASARDQARNTRNTESAERITHEGESLSILEWSERTGIKRSTLWMRLHKYNWPVSQALAQKVG